MELANQDFEVGDMLHRFLSVMSLLSVDVVTVAAIWVWLSRRTWFCRVSSVELAD